jgi:hypothetical protein
MFITRSRYVLPGSNGRVAFSLKPTALVTGEGLLPAIGARYEPFWEKYTTAESAKSTRKWSPKVIRPNKNTAGSYRMGQLTGDRLRSAWIRNAEEMLQKDMMFCVVPVTHHNGELGVVVCSVSFIWRVQEERCTKPIHIYSLHENKQN